MTKIKVIAVVVFSFLLQSCVTDRIHEGKIKQFDECFKRTNSELIKIQCPSDERPILTTSQRLHSLERFKDFLAHIEEKILELVKLHEHYPEHLFSNKHSHSPKALDMLRDNKFIVRLTFRNYSLFPTKHFDHDTFTIGSSEGFKVKWEDIIFKRYLGNDYKYLEPELGIVTDGWIVIRVQINGINELEDIIYKDPLVRIKHIGDPVIFEWISPN